MAAQTAERLRAAILAGQYSVGQPLRELELCKTLGVSRVPLREALHRLEGERIVTIRPNRGAEVTRLTEADLREIAEACRLIEGHLLRLAAPRLTLEILDEAEETLARLDKLDDPREWARVNWEFHASLYSAAERPLLVGLVGDLRARAELAMLILVANKKRRADLNREHRAILACLRARRASKAGALLDAHLQGGKEKVLKLLALR